jgi:hypothetical protein
VVDGKVVNHGTRWVREFSSGNACAVYDKGDVVIGVELLAFNLLPVADADPPPHPEGATELLNLHEGGFLSGRWVPFVHRRADFEDTLRGWWCSDEG